MVCGGVSVVAVVFCFEWAYAKLAAVHVGSAILQARSRG